MDVLSPLPLKPASLIRVCCPLLITILHPHNGPSKDILAFFEECLSPPLDLQLHRESWTRALVLA